MKYEQAQKILSWWADNQQTLVVVGSTGHVYDIVWNPVAEEVQERWLGSNVFHAAGQIIIWRYQTQEPCPLQFHQVIAEAPGAKERYGIK